MCNLIHHRSMVQLKRHLKFADFNKSSNERCRSIYKKNEQLKLQIKGNLKDQRLTMFLKSSNVRKANGFTRNKNRSKMVSQNKNFTCSVIYDVG